MSQQNHSSLLGLCPGTDHLLVPKRLAHSHWMSHVPFAYWLVEAARPRLLVELGSYTGVSFCAFCQQVAQLGLETDCYAVDSWQGDDNMGQYSERVYEDMLAYVSETYPSFAYLIRSDFDAALELFGDKSIDLLHIDGYHAYEAMLHDFEAWLPKMSSSGIVLMHDINARIPGYGGVRAWQELQGRFPSFTFTHGYGLGVLLIGDSPPQRLRDLVDLGQDAEVASDVRRYFSRLGALYDRCNELHSRQQALQEKMERESAAALRAKDDEIAGVLQAKDDEIIELRKAVDGYSRSLSWRLTAPLRRLMGMLRDLQR